MQEILTEQQDTFSNRQEKEICRRTSIVLSYNITLNSSGTKFLYN